MLRRFNARALEPTAPRCHPERLEEPTHWRKPRTVFVSPLGDLFHVAIDADYIARVWAVMARCSEPWRVRYLQTKANVYGPHKFMILTKRPDRMWSILSDQRFKDEVARLLGRDIPVWPLPNVMLGVTAETQEWAGDRISTLVTTPAAFRFVSCEPLLGPVNLRPFLVDLDWVIVGGERGPKARPMHPAWWTRIRDDCAAAGVPFYFKSHGEWVRNVYAEPGGAELLKVTLKKGREVILDADGRGTFPVNMERIGHKAADLLLDGDSLREMPTWEAR
jgi:protein gp37